MTVPNAAESVLADVSTAVESYIPHNNVADIIGNFQNNKLSFHTSLKTDSDEEKGELYNALSDAKNLVEYALNKELVLKGFILTPVTVTDAQTGEARETIRTVLVTDAGNFSAVSDTIVGDLQTIVGLFGSDFGSKGIRVVARSVRTRSGYTTTTLAIAGFAKQSK